MMMRLQRVLFRRWIRFSGGLLLATTLLAFIAQVSAGDGGPASAWKESVSQVLLVLELACLILAPVALLVVLVRSRPMLVLHYLAGPRSLQAVMVAGMMAGMMAASGVILCDIGTGLLLSETYATPIHLGSWQQEGDTWRWHPPSGKRTCAVFSPSDPHWENREGSSMPVDTGASLSDVTRVVAWNPDRPFVSLLPVLERAALAWSITFCAGAAAVDLGLISIVLGSLLAIPALGIVVVEGSRHRGGLGVVIALVGMLGSGLWWRWRFRH